MEFNDRLPNPYRMINKLLYGLIDSAIEISEVNRKYHPSHGHGNG